MLNWPAFAKKGIFMIFKPAILCSATLLIFDTKPAKGGMFKILKNLIRWALLTFMLDMSTVASTSNPYLGSHFLNNLFLIFLKYPFVWFLTPLV